MQYSHQQVKLHVILQILQYNENKSDINSVNYTIYQYQIKQGPIKEEDAIIL